MNLPFRSAWSFFGALLALVPSCGSDSDVEGGTAGTGGAGARSSDAGPTGGSAAEDAPRETGGQVNGGTSGAADASRDTGQGGSGGSSAAGMGGAAAGDSGQAGVAGSAGCGVNGASCAGNPPSCCAGTVCVPALPVCRTTCTTAGDCASRCCRPIENGSLVSACFPTTSCL